MMDLVSEGSVMQSQPRNVLIVIGSCLCLDYLFLFCLGGIDYRSFAHSIYVELGLRSISGGLSAQKCVDICWQLFVLSGM